MADVGDPASVIVQIMGNRCRHGTTRAISAIKEIRLKGFGHVVRHHYREAG